jgi:hypothetical protein
MNGVQGSEEKYKADHIPGKFGKRTKSLKYGKVSFPGDYWWPPAHPGKTSGSMAKGES